MAPSIRIPVRPTRTKETTMDQQKQAERRQFLQQGVGVAAGLAMPGLAIPGNAVAQARPEGRDFAGQTLTALVYSGINENTWRKHFVQPFEEATGAKVVIDAAWTEGIAKLKTAPANQAPFDILMTDPTQGYPAIDEGLFRKIELKNIPNLAKFHKRILAGRVYDEQWGVPFISSAMTLAWNTEAYPNGLESWTQLLDGPARGNMMLYSQYYMSLYTFAAMKAEKDRAVGKAGEMMMNDIDGVLRFAKENRDAVKYWWPSTADAVNALARKNVVAGNIHGNGLLAPMRDKKPVNGRIPPGDVAYVQLFLVSPKSVKNPALVEAAMNYFCSEAFQRASAETGELPANIPAIAQAQGEKDNVWATAYPNTQAEFDQLQYYPYDAYFKHLDKIKTTWEREIIRK
jgi:spermidine/putrescine-binding protein